MPPLSDMYIPNTNQPRTAIFRISVIVFFISVPQLDKLKVHTVILMTLTSTLRGVPLSSFKRKLWMRAGTNGASFVLPIMKNNKYTSKVYMENKTNLSFLNNKIMVCKNACSFCKTALNILVKRTLKRFNCSPVRHIQQSFQLKSFQDSQKDPCCIVEEDQETVAKQLLNVVCHFDK